MRPLPIRRVGRRAPMRPHPSVSCPAVERCRAIRGQRPFRSARRRGRPRIVPDGSGSDVSTVDGTEFDPQVADNGPGARVRGDRADPALDDVGGQVPAHPRVLDGDLRRDGDALGRLRYRRQPAVRDAVQRRLQQRGTRDGQPAKQIRGGVGGSDRLGDHAVHGPGVQRGFDLERGRPGDRIARRDRRLQWRRAPPRRAAERSAGSSSRAWARREGRRGALRRTPRPHTRRAPIPPAPRRTRRSWAGPAAGSGCRSRAQVARPATVTAYPADRQRHPGG